MPIKVKLREDSIYTAYSNNPKIGSAYEIEGEIHSIYNNIKKMTIYINSMGAIRMALEGIRTRKDYNINVRWYNTEFNTYKIEDLIVYLPDYVANLDDILNNEYTTKNRNVFKSIW